MQITCPSALQYHHGWLHLNPPITTLLPKMKILLTLVIAASLVSCDHGLEPPQRVEPGFGGTITFVKDSWPPQDSLVNLWVFASQIYPLDSSSVFTGLFANPPSIYLYPSLLT